MPIRNLTGQTFGLLTAVKPTPERERHSVVWAFRCACGTRVKRAARAVAPAALAVSTPNCGCLNRGRASPFAVDLTGARFGRLVAIACEDNLGQGLRWRCECECGNFTIARAKDLRAGTTTSCGCGRGGRRGYGTGREWRAATIGAGDQFGLLTVQGLACKDKGSRHYLCRCECGGQTIVRSGLLRTGQTRSCGCLRRRGTAAINRRHGIETAGNTAAEIQQTPEFRLSLNASMRPSGLMCSEAA